MPSSRDLLPAMMRCQISASLSVPVSIAAIPFSVTAIAPNWRRSVVTLRALLEAIQMRMPHGVLVHPLSLEGVRAHEPCEAHGSVLVSEPCVASIRAEAQIELPRESSGWSRFDFVASACDAVSECLAEPDHSGLLDHSIADPVFRIREAECYRPALVESLHASALNLVRGGGHAYDSRRPRFSLTVDRHPEVLVEPPDSAIVSLGATVEYTHQDSLSPTVHRAR